MKTVSEVAAQLAPLTGHPESAIARQMRGWIQTGLLKPTEREARGTTGQIEAALFDDVGVCATRLTLALSAVTQLRNLDSLIPKILADSKSQRVKLYVDGTQEKLSFEAAIEGTRLRPSDDWILEVIILRDLIEHRIDTRVQWVRNGVRDFGNLDPRAPDTFIIGGEIEAVVSIPFSRMIRPLLES